MSQADGVGTGGFSREVPDLYQDHFEQLHVGSGISVDVIRERGYRTILGHQPLAHLGFRPQQARQTPGLLLPIHTPDGAINKASYRPDVPRLDRDGRELKYELAAGTTARLDVPPRCLPWLADPSIPLWITEGQKKCDALATHSMCAMALLGVWNFKGRNEFGGVTLLADFDCVAWNGRVVYLVFDSDLMHKKSVRDALDRLTEHLKRKGAAAQAVYLPDGEGGKKVGVDDYLLTHTVEDLRRLIDEPPTKPQAAPPTFELLDEPPPTLTRPLALIENRAYIVSWPWVRTTTGESIDKKSGELVHHDPPIVTKERRLLVIRDDGTVFGDLNLPLTQLGLDVHLGQPPRDVKLWTAAGIRSYRAGCRADPRDVFARVVCSVDRFLAFDRSLAPQQTMAEFVACYALSTWFLDAFDVIGFLWPNGPYGSGKTKLGLFVCEVAYLGEALLGGSSYATLRDLADYGATLLFDDAEALADPKKSDPDKRNLLLAGNRRGAYVTVKEAGPDGTWVTRYVNAYCTRLFTATRVPDPILASRSIVVPLVRTADPKKANAEVLDETQWPCSRRQLLDDLWAVALANLPLLGPHEAAVNAAAPLIGRNLEPWRPTLAVAHWLDELGENGLYRRMVDLAQAYQVERMQLEFVDHTRIVVRALVDVACAPFAPLTPSAPFPKWEAPFEIPVSDVATRANEIAAEEDIGPTKEDEAFTNEKRVGRVLSTLRLKAAPRSSGQKRRRVLTLQDIHGIALAYGVPFPLDAQQAAPSGYETEHSGQTEQTEQVPFSTNGHGPHGRCISCNATLAPTEDGLCRECHAMFFGQGVGRVTEAER